MGRVNQRALILREVAISAVINAVISLLFFLGVFGLSRPVPLSALGGDGRPQSFMVALMAGLVPSLIATKRLGRSAAPIIIRSFLIALVALVLFGGAGWLLFNGRAGAAPALPVLVGKMLYGALLGAAVTALSLPFVFNQKA